MRIAALAVIVLGLGVVAAVGAGTFAQEPSPGAPPAAATSPAPAPIPGFPAPAASAPAAPAQPGPAVAPDASTPSAAAPGASDDVTAVRGPSRAVGRPWNGRLVNGVQLPEVSADWLTWDPALKQIPNRPWRRWGTAKLIRMINRVLAAFHAAHPELPQVLVGDLSRPNGGIFDKRFGGLGHGSHQNGLDVDVYYPRADRRLRAARRPDQIDRALSQELVDRFVAEDVQFVFVGPHTGLRGPRKVVQPLVHHDDHLHVRIFPPRG